MISHNKAVIYYDFAEGVQSALIFVLTFSYNYGQTAFISSIK